MMYVKWLANEVNVMDRRKRKSRQAILQACISLSKEKEFSKITVNEIVDYADLNRGTFYLHFLDKYDMMTSFENEMLEKIEQVIIENIPEEQFEQQFVQSRYNTIVHLLRCYMQNQDLLYLLLSSSHSSSFQMRLREKLSTLILDIILPKLNLNTKDIPTDLLIIIFTSLSLNLAEYAYHSTLEIDIEKHAQFLINIMLQGPIKALGIFPSLEKNLNYFVK